MSFPRYPSYKDSGVERLGEIPTHWKQLPVWLLFELGRGRVISHEEIIDNAGDYPVYSSQTENDGVMGWLNSYAFDGDYLTWTTDGANAGTVFRRRGKFSCTNVCGTLKPRSPEVLLDYCSYALAISTASFVRHDINPKLMNNVMATIRIPLPSFSEQLGIAEFLGGETAKIDQLVAVQHRLIELLKEKRQSVISHAVTIGLNPDAPMKPSGIEWLGYVPEHWDMIRIGRKIELQRGVDITKDEQNPGYVPVVSSGGIASFHDHALVRGPGVVVGRKGTAGAIYYVDEDFWPHDTTLYVKEFGGNNPRFVFYKLQSMDLASFDTGSANPTINRNLIHPITVSWPPVDEQTLIALCLDEVTKELSILAAEAQRAIDLLQERRTALISAAVTGKIDVRGLVETVTE